MVSGEESGHHRGNGYIMMLRHVKDKHYQRAARLHQAVGHSSFTTALAAAILQVEPSVSLTGTMKHLHETGVIEIANGERRAHYRNKNGATVWRFTTSFHDHIRGQENADV